MHVNCAALEKSVLENVARIRASYYRRTTTWRRTRRLGRTAARIRARYYQRPTVVLNELSLSNF